MTRKLFADKYSVDELLGTGAMGKVYRAEQVGLDRSIAQAREIETRLMELPGVEGVLTRIIAELRKALGDDAREPSYIETIHGRGYRLLIKPGAVSDEESA